MSWEQIPGGLDGVSPVEKVDQTTRWNDLYFVQALGPPAQLTATAVIGESPGFNRVINVSSVANISIGDWLIIAESTLGEPRFQAAEVESISTLAVTLTTMVAFAFPTGTNVISTTRDMNVDGSTTPQIFSIQAGGDFQIDITRILMACTTTDIVDLSKFADIAGGLARPMYLRVKENGDFSNKAQIKTNFDFVKYAFDWTPYAQTNPVQGQNGFGWRFSLNGDDKHGAVTRITGDDQTLQWVIQSDLTTILDLQSIGALHEVD